MRKQIVLLLIAILFLSSLTGCWSRREVADLAIVVGLGIDKNEEGEYVVSVQVINPSETATSTMGGGYTTAATTYSTRGKIVFEALRKLSKEAPRKLYLAHLRMIVIGEEVAKEGIYDALDFLSRDAEMRTDFYIVVAKNYAAEDILKVVTSVEKIPANDLFNSLENSAEEWAATGKVRLNELMDDIVSEGIQANLTGVTLKGKPEGGLTKANVESIAPKTVITFTGIAAFKKNKLVGWLNEKESKGFHYIKDLVKSTVIVFDMNDSEVGIELVTTKTEIIPHIKKEGPEIEVKVTGEANVADANTKLELLNENVIKELEEKTNSDVKNVIQSTLERGQKDFETDIFGFGKRIHKTDPKNWEKLKSQWSDLFPNVPVEVNVDIKIRRIGTISDPFHNELTGE